MIPTILIGLLVAAAFFAIVGKGIYNRRHHKGGCSACGGQLRRLPRLRGDSDQNPPEVTAGSIDHTRAILSLSKKGAPACKGRRPFFGEKQTGQAGSFGFRPALFSCAPWEESAKALYSCTLMMTFIVVSRFSSMYW